MCDLTKLKLFYITEKQTSERHTDIARQRREWPKKLWPVHIYIGLSVIYPCF